MATAGAPKGAPERATKEPDGNGRWSERIKLIGGLVAVGLGVTAVVGIAVGAFIVGTQTAATIAGSTAGVVWSIVGAYFGVKVGTDQTKTALDNAQAESAKKDRHAARARFTRCTCLPPRRGRSKTKPGRRPTSCRHNAERALDE
jgi:hypothetical protein